MRTVLWYLDLTQHASYEFPSCYDHQGYRDPADRSIIGLRK